MTAALEKTTKPATLRQQLESPAFALQVAKALPRHLKPDRFIRIACTTLMRVPKLAQCDQVSFFNALLTLSQLGIEPDGRRAHLIPFENRKRNCVECQLIIDYKGLAELVMRSGVVSSLHADVVCDRDEFEFNCGEIIRHRINFREPRGEVYAAYAVCSFKDGARKAEVMSRDEIETVRSRSRASQAGPWVTDWAEMAKKTVFRRLSKWLPLSPEFRDAVEADDETNAAVTTQRGASASVEVVSFAMPADPPAQLESAAADEMPTSYPETPTSQPEQSVPAPNPRKRKVEFVKPADEAAATDAAAAVESATAKPWFAQVAEFLSAAGVDFGTFKQWLNASGRSKPEETENWAGWEDIPELLAKNLMETAAVVKCATIYGKK